MTYKEIEHGIVEKLRQIQDMFTMLEAEEDIITLIREDIELMSTKKYTVAVVGQFKRGKSSLINTLLGGEVLPADVLPATATVNRITFGGIKSSIRAAVSFKDGTSAAINTDELYEYVSKVTEDGAKQAALVEEVVVYAPAKICENHIDIIDTPGLNDEENMTQITYKALSRADAVIFTISKMFPVEETEAVHICNIMKDPRIRNIMFVITYIDTFDNEAESMDEYNAMVDRFIPVVAKRIKDMVRKMLERDEDADALVMEKARGILENMTVLGLSSKYALNSFATNNWQEREKSRFDTFNNTLTRELTAKQVDNAVFTAVSDSVSLLGSRFDNLYQRRKADYEHEIKTVNENLQDMRKNTADWGKNLSMLYTGAHDDLERIAQSFNSHKNAVTSVFIKELSALRSDTHGDIKAALIKAKNTAESLLTGQWIPAAAKNLQEEHGRIFDGFEQSMIDRVKDAAEFFGAGGGVPLIKARIDEALESAFIMGDKIEWTVSPIPEVPDLSKLNVIDSVANAADAMIRRIIYRLNEAVNNARVNLFALINAAARDIRKAAEQAAEERVHAADMKLKALEMNYRMLSREKPVIINECETLLENLRKMGNL